MYSLLGGKRWFSSLKPTWATEFLDHKDQSCQENGFYRCARSRKLCTSLNRNHNTFNFRPPSELLRYVSELELIYWKMQSFMRSLQCNSRLSLLDGLKRAPSIIHAAKRYSFSRRPFFVRWTNPTSRHDFRNFETEQNAQSELTESCLRFPRKPLSELLMREAIA